MEDFSNEEESSKVVPVIVHNNNVNSLAIVLVIQDEIDEPYYEISIYPRDNHTLENIKETYILIPPNQSATFDRLET